MLSATTHVLMITSCSVISGSHLIVPDMIIFEHSVQLGAEGRGKYPPPPYLSGLIAPMSLGEKLKQK
jgi:hypothetical protein